VRIGPDRSQRAAARRGAPLFVLSCVLGGWVLARTAAWSFWPDIDLPSRLPPALRDIGRPAMAVAEDRSSAVDHDALRRDFDPLVRIALPSSAHPHPRYQPATPGDWTRRMNVAPRPAPPPMPAIEPRIAGGHALLWLAGAAQLPGPRVLLERVGQLSASLGGPSLSGAPSSRRWSADAWAMFRRGGGTGSAAPFAPTYGGSQVGAVLRFRLAPASEHRPTAYVRATAALAAGGDREMAAGLAVRPVASLPVVVAGEGRVTQAGGNCPASHAPKSTFRVAMSVGGRRQPLLMARCGSIVSSGTSVRSRCAPGQGCGVGHSGEPSGSTSARRRRSSSPKGAAQLGSIWTGGCA